MEEISKETIVSAAGGDKQAFEIIYREYFNFVCNVAIRVVNRPQDSQDLAQEVFMNIYRNLKSFRFRSQLKTWIYRIAMNTAINYARKRSRRQKRREEYASELELSRSQERDPREVLDEKLAPDTVGALLDILNPGQRACILLRGLEGLSYQEIASVLRIPLNTVRSRIKRARQLMYREKERLSSCKKRVLKDQKSALGYEM
jgi:RNA polymerase sigma-70 factor, ECF subfamily